MNLHATRSGVLFLCLFGLAGCGDGRPDAAGAAHLFNSTDVVVQVQVKPGGADGASYTLAPGQGQFVPLSKADTYVVSVTSPAEHASYRQEVIVPADDKTDIVFDIGSASRFAMVPTYHVPRDMPEMQARSEVDRMRSLGDHQEYVIATPAAKHILPRGVFYTFGDEVETFSRLTEAGRTVEIRYKLSALTD